MHMWPQVLVAAFMLLTIAFSIVHNGELMKDPTIKAKQTIWASLWFALVLGMGGFWEMR